MQFHSIWERRRAKRVLEQAFGAELYSPEDLDQSTRYYVPPKCSEVDPTGESEPQRDATTKESLFNVIDQFLADDSRERYLLLLGDSGTGKTSCVLNYYARNRRRGRRKRSRIKVVPLGIPFPDRIIEDIDRRHDTVLFLDALDEDTSAIDDHRKRLRELLQNCANFRRVLITCRTQFFPGDEEIPLETGIARTGSRKAGEKLLYELQKIYLSPLDDGEVRQFLRMRYRLWQYRQRKQARELIAAAPSLTARPMLLAYIPDLLERREPIRFVFELYEALVASWLTRESDWLSPQTLAAFSQRLAAELYINRGSRGAERLPRYELQNLARKWNITANEFGLRARSLLNRDAEGNVKFAHRSIMEYLFVKRFIAGASECRSVQWTDQMLEFLSEMIASGQWTQLAPSLPLAQAMQMFTRDIRCTPSNSVTVDGAQARYGQLKQLFHRFRGVIGTFKVQPARQYRQIDIDACGTLWLSTRTVQLALLDEVEAVMRNVRGEAVSGRSDWRLPTFEEVALLAVLPQATLIQFLGHEGDHRVWWTSDKTERGEPVAVALIGDGPPIKIATGVNEMILVSRAASTL